MLSMADDTAFLKLESLSDIERLIEDGIEESLNLDYKASPSLSRNSSEVIELCKDVSAFANSAGGQIIYGVAEDKSTHKPVDGDLGVTDPKITREWIEQVINSKIQPRISGVRIARFDNKRGGSIFTVTIPPSQIGPHQAPDKKYYRRFELQSVPMEDYEIRDVFNRAVAPELYVKVGFPTGLQHTLEFKIGNNVSESIPWLMWVGNRSKSPAEYARVILGLDADFQFVSQLGYGTRGERTVGGNNYKTFYANWSVLERRFPIFKEAEFPLGEKMMIAVREQYIPSTLFRAFVGIQAPGFSSIEYYNITCKSAVLTIHGPLPKN
jgi:hypothetical protein